MNSIPTRNAPAAALPAPLPASTVPMALALRARVANLALTAQVQMAYACTQQAHESTCQSIARIEQTWPDTPLRKLVLQVYRAQADCTRMMECDILASARRNCGLAFARV